VIDKNQIKTFLQKVCKSKGFSDAKTYNDLLNYLVNCTLKKKIPKEITIAIEIFGKESSFNPSENPIVRVYLHNLREKLNHYYENEGKKDNLRIRIPKGHYEVEFVSKKTIKDFVDKNIRTVIELLLILAVIFLFIFVVLVKQKNQSLRNEITENNVDIIQSPIWSDFLSSQQPILILLGEMYYYREYQEDIDQWVTSRTGGIDSEEELNEFISRHPEKTIQSGRAIPYFAMNSVWPLPEIISVLTKAHKNWRLQRSSYLTPRDLKENNIIFLGYYKTLGSLEQVTMKMNFYFDKNNKSIILNSVEEDTAKIYKFPGSAHNFHEDYGVIYKIPGPNKNTILIISSFSATGTRGVVKFLSQADHLKQLEDLFQTKYDTVPSYFQILSKVSGYGRADLSSEILHYFEVAEDIKLW